MRVYLFIFGYFSWLQKDPSKRFGRGPTGSDEVKHHKWFKPINWRLGKLGRVFVLKLQENIVLPTLITAGQTCHCWTLQLPVQMLLGALSRALVIWGLQIHFYRGIIVRSFVVVGWDGMVFMCKVSKCHCSILLGGFFYKFSWYFTIWVNV